MRLDETCNSRILQGKRFITVRKLDWTPVLKSVRAKLSLNTDVSSIRVASSG